MATQDNPETVPYTVGPVQVIVFGFDRTDQFRGEVVEELANLRGRGLIRLIDLFVAVKKSPQEFVAVEMNDLTEQESVEFGRVVGKLLGTTDVSAGEVAAAAVERTMAAAAHSVGMDYKGLRSVVDNLPDGKAFGVLMFEHVWAIPLGSAIRRAGGVPLAQAFITREALIMVGEELRAISEAERTIEIAEAVKDVAILDMLATLEDAEAMRTAIAAEVVRTLAVADVLDEADVSDAISALAAAGLVETKYLEAASKDEAQEAAEDKAFFAAEE